MDAKSRKRIRLYMLGVLIAAPHMASWFVGSRLLGEGKLDFDDTFPAGITVFVMLMIFGTVMVLVTSMVSARAHHDQAPVALVLKRTASSLLRMWLFAVPWSLIFAGIFMFVSKDEGPSSFRNPMGDLGDYLIFMAVSLAITLPILALMRHVVEGIEVFVPGAVLRDFAGDEENMRWMINEDRFSERARLEVARHLAGRGPASVVAALTCELPDVERTSRAVHRTLEELPLEGAREVITKAIGRLREGDQRRLIERWSECDRRAELLSAIASDVRVASDPTWAPRIAEVAFDEGIDDGQAAATTVLGMQKFGLHERALDYLERFGRPIDIPALERARDGFSLNPGLDTRIDALIERIRARHGVEVGALSVAEPSADGALSVAEGEAGALTRARVDEECPDPNGGTKQNASS